MNKVASIEYEAKPLDRSKVQSLGIYTDGDFYYFLIILILQLIEVLLVLQSLQGNGEDGYKAERAFYHYMGDVQKTKDHLAAAKQVRIVHVLHCQ